MPKSGQRSVVSASGPAVPLGLTLDVRARIFDRVVEIVWSMGDVVTLLGALPRRGALPMRTVVVPSAEFAAALRRSLVSGSVPELQVGTRIVAAPELAEEKLRETGVIFQTGEESRRRSRVRIAFRMTTDLQYFQAELLATAPGWDTAFARTIDELEAAGVSFRDLEERSAREQDLAAIWRAVDEVAATSWTRERILLEASRRPLVRSREDEIVAVVTGDEPASHAAFIRSLDARMAWLSARPVSESIGARLSSIWGWTEGLTRTAPPAAIAGSSSRAGLASMLFSTAEEKTPADGSVVLEEYAGIDDELQAAADWVAAEVLEHGTPLGSMAILVARRDPLAGLVADRVMRLPFEQASSARIVGGRALAETASGAHILLLLRSLREELPAGALVDLLPRLVRADGRIGKRRLSRREAVHLVSELGAGDGLTWNGRYRDRVLALEARLSQAIPFETTRATKERREDERLLELLRVAQSAVASLCELAVLLRSNATADALVERLLSFFSTWLPSPTAYPIDIADLLREPLDEAMACRIGSILSGMDALDIVESVLLETRLPSEETNAEVFVGTIEQAAGIPFESVRILGLAEGLFPGGVREDPVLPDTLRVALGPAVPLRRDRPEQERRALHRVVLGTKSRISCSVARTDLDGTEREPSPLLFDIAGALSDIQRGESFATHLQSRFAESRARRLNTPPLTERARLVRAAESRTVRIPPQPVEPSASRSDIGVLLGLSPDRPLTASALARLLECPYRFLFEDVMFDRPPETVPSSRELEPMQYGTLFHRAIEALYTEHGPSIVAGALPVAAFEALAREIASRLLDALVLRHPMDEATKERCRARLQGDVIGFVRADVGSGRTFVAVEREFGWEEPLGLQVRGRSLFVRGFLDRLDIEDGRTLVRDLKTGTPHPRVGTEERPTPRRDLQIGLYVMVVRQLSSVWELPPEVTGAYAYAGPWGTEERAFRADASALIRETEGWLDIALDLLTAREFPRTPTVRDCEYCPFRIPCGGAVIEDGSPDRSSPVARFLALKQEESGTGR